MRWEELAVHNLNLDWTGQAWSDAFGQRVVGQKVVGVRLHAHLNDRPDDGSWPYRTQGSESMSAAIRLANGSTLVLCRNWSGADCDICSWPCIDGEPRVQCKYNMVTESTPLPAPLQVIEASAPTVCDPTVLEGREVVRLISAGDTDYLELSGGLLLAVTCFPHREERRALARVLRMTAPGEATVVSG